MTRPEYELVVTLVDGQARELNRTFEPGVALAPFSVGSQGDWLVAAQGVASVHLWLQFDGQRLFAAGADSQAAVYIQGQRLGNTWHEVPDRTELRFGQARMVASYRSVGRSASNSPPARVEQPREPTRIERAAALPLPSFFSDRLRAGSDPSPVAPEPRRPRSREQLRFPAQDRKRASPQRLRDRRTRAPWALLLIPVGMLPFLLIFLWLIGSRRRPAELPSAPAPTATTVSPAEPSAARLAQTPLDPPEPPVPFLEEAPPTARPALVDVPTLVLPSAHPPAFPQKVADKPVPRVGAEPWTISEGWREHHERQLQAPNRARAKLIFLGDSITEGWGVSPAYRASFGKYSPLNLGIASDVTQNVLWRLEHGALDGTHPDAVVLMIGVNNLAGGFSAQETVAGIRAILVAIQAHLPDARVLLLGILPARQAPDNPLRARIAEANSLLAKLPASAHVSFHDVGTVLLEPDGTIAKETLRDFVHPTAAGYVRLTEAVAPLISPLVRTPSEPAASESPGQPQ